MRRWLSHNWVVLVIACSLPASVLVAHDTAKNTVKANAKAQYRGCQRGNKLRRELNHRVMANRNQKAVLDTFLDSAIVARTADYARTHTSADLVAIRAYTKAVRRLAVIQYHALPYTDCDKEIPNAH